MCLPKSVIELAWIQRLCYGHPLLNIGISSSLLKKRFFFRKAWIWEDLYWRATSSLSRAPIPGVMETIHARFRPEAIRTAPVPRTRLPWIQFSLVRRPSLVPHGSSLNLNLNSINSNRNNSSSRSVARFNDIGTLMAWSSTTSRGSSLGNLPDYCEGWLLSAIGGST